MLVLGFCNSSVYSFLAENEESDSETEELQGYDTVYRYCCHGDYKTTNDVTHLIGNLNNGHKLPTTYL